MSDKPDKFTKYISITCAVLSLLFAFTAAGFSQIDRIYEGNAVNLVQNAKIEQLQKDEAQKNEEIVSLRADMQEGFGQMNNQMNSKFEKVYTMLIDIKGG